MIYKTYMRPVRDPYDIWLMVKAMVPSYELVYNLRKERYEVHDVASGSWNTLVSVLPYDRIDMRTIDYLKKHRSDNFGNVRAEIDEHNFMLDRLARKKREVSLETSLRQCGKI